MTIQELQIVGAPNRSVLSWTLYVPYQGGYLVIVKLRLKEYPGDFIEMINISLAKFDRA